MARLLSSLSAGFKSFLVKTAVFVVAFILIQILTIQLTDITRLPSQFDPIYLVDIAKAGLVVLVLFVVAYRKKFSGLTRYRVNINDIIAFGFLEIMSIVGYFALKRYILDNLGFAESNLLLFRLMLYLVLVIILIFLALAVYGFSLVKEFIKRFKKELLIFFFIFIVVLVLEIQVQKLWYYLSTFVASVVYRMLNIGGHAVLSSYKGLPTIGIGDFIVAIDKPCSGIESLFLFTLLYSFISAFDWNKLNKRKLMLLFIPGLVGAFAFNILRVYFLILVGVYLSPSLALGLFHTNAGFVLFMVYFGIFWYFAYNWMRTDKKKSNWVKNIYKRYMSDSLYRNSIYLMLGTLVMAVFGFFFWILVSKFYSAEEIGLATTIISVMSLITSISLLGMGTGIIRYLPKSERKNEKINTTFSLVALVTIVLTAIFLLGIGIFSPRLIFIKDNVIYSLIFIISMVVSSWGSLIESVFMAYRSAGAILFKNSLFSFLKLFLPLAFIGLGAFGIFSSWMIATAIPLIICFIILSAKFSYRPKLVFYDSVLKKIGNYSFGNYVAGLIYSLPTLILPIMITNLLHPETTAYYYMAMMIASVLFIIPQATSNALFAEGSYNEKQIGKQIRKASWLIALLLIPGIIFTIFVGEYVLLFFGKQYSAEGFRFLQLLAFSGIFISINSVFSSIFRVRKRVWALIAVSGITALVTLLLSYYFIALGDGLIGVGWAWIIGNAAGLVCYAGLSVIRKK